MAVGSEGSSSVLEPPAVSSINWIVGGPGSPEGEAKKARAMAAHSRV